ncbi:uncharacterized protein [Neodiprion pinetum]|uniref:uncharacterized protein isoform X2 n=1 Tax=Neodiprion pinetum TaxID=441929 RepID=UPI001EE029F3|nr:uncharacterized protein LOC124216701 isoform X2 [Neodiprion pinetum]
MNSLHFYRNNNKNRNILSNAAYFTANVKDPEYKCINYTLRENNCLQRSVSADNVVIRSRGFKPSDIHDPAKRHFLENLTTKILHVDMDGGETKRIDLQKLLTPANDSDELFHAKTKKMYASSYFYAPSHPTVEDQVELARRISHSLSDAKNVKSKGQSMYVNRKKRSVKWIHDGNGVESGDEPETISMIRKDKIPLKCVMNPNGKVLDIHGIQALGEEVNIEETPSHPEKLFDIVRDLNNQKGRGAEIFAKRRKRSEKWVVEKDDQSQPITVPSSEIHSQMPYAGYPKLKQEADVKENSALPMLDPLLIPGTFDNTVKATTNITCQPFYNPFALDLSLTPETTLATARGNRYVQYQRDVGSYNGTRIQETKNIQTHAMHSAETNVVNRREEKDTATPKKNFAIKRKTVEYPAGSKNSRSPSNRTKYFYASRGTPYHDSYNGEMIFTPRLKNNPHQRIGYKECGIENMNNQNNAGDGKSENNEYDQCENGVNNEYTPIPVKQLIKEFEKTCRPVMHYKQNCPNKTATQLGSFDNEMISRYFEGRTYVSTITRNEDIERLNHWNEACRQDRNVNGCIPAMKEEEWTSDQSYVDDASPGSNIDANPGISLKGNVSENSRERDWRLKYIEDDETSTTDNSTDTSESTTQSICTFAENEARERQGELIVSEFRDNVNCRVRANGRAQKPSDPTPGVLVPADTNDNPLVVAMVASEEDILQTIKQLRRTPVLQNLIPAGASPELRPFSDISPHIGDNPRENTEYRGPKLNSYQRLSNYNTAPRGWDQAHTYYRPITFGRPQESIVYSDF